MCTSLNTEWDVFSIFTNFTYSFLGQVKSIADINACTIFQPSVLHLNEPWVLMSFPTLTGVALGDVVLFVTHVGSVQQRQTHCTRSLRSKQWLRSPWGTSRWLHSLNGYSMWGGGLKIKKWCKLLWGLEAKRLKTRTTCIHFQTMGNSVVLRNLIITTET